jgi:hypothetical protein
MFQYISVFRSRFLSHLSITKPLGRWSLETCDTKIYSRVDLANEDHCGICSVAVMQEQEQSQQPLTASKATYAIINDDIIYLE